MDINQLRKKLDSLAESLKNEKKSLLKARLKGLSSAYPFNEYEYIIMFLSQHGIITFNDYERLRKEYLVTNRYLELYDLSPRIFGGIWAEDHIIDLDKRIKKPSTILDSEYVGEYDLWIDGIKIEVKASRAANKKIRGSIVSKAVHYTSEEPFWMNFQQLKKDISDVFIFIGVWPNEINYWVLSNEEVKSNNYLSPQHRGGVEYQIGITNKNVLEFNRYKANPSDMVAIIKEKFDQGR